MPLAPRLFSFPFFSTAPSLFLSLFPAKLRGNRQILGSEPSRGWFGPKISQILGQIGKMPGILRRTRAYLEFTLRPPGYFVDFLNFASDFAPDQLSDSGKTASFQNGAPNTLCFPWKFPETQSAGDPLFSFLFAGKPATAYRPSKCCVKRSPIGGMRCADGSMDGQKRPSSYAWHRPNSLSCARTA